VLQAPVGYVSSRHPAAAGAAAAAGWSAVQQSHIVRKRIDEMQNIANKLVSKLGNMFALRLCEQYAFEG
jgi:sugar (pentulose or hexulose) kinase